jgi:SAM-dependent methyltransferase
MAYLHPLAYLLGLEGAALLRSFAGDFPDRAFVEARVAEIRALLDEDGLAAAAVEVDSVDAVDGYRVWSRTYDLPGNGAFPLEEPFVLGIVDGLPPGRALDAACGTGRYARLLSARGHEVVGVDSSPEMLEAARGVAPEAEFRLGSLEKLPAEDRAFELVVCALALTHVADLAPVMAEFARVLRPGGHLVVSNMHADAILFGSIPRVVRDDGRPARIATFRHETGDYFRAAVGAGLAALGCDEPRFSLSAEPPSGAADGPFEPGDWFGWPWTLNAVLPQAAFAALRDRPATVIWHFQRPEGGR